MAERPQSRQSPRYLKAPMSCAICNREWIAVYPEEAPRLGCPDCGYMNETPRAEHDERPPWL